MLAYALNTSDWCFHPSEWVPAVASSIHYVHKAMFCGILPFVNILCSIVRSVNILWFRFKLFCIINKFVFGIPGCRTALHKSIDSTITIHHSHSHFLYIYKKHKIIYTKQKPWIQDPGSWIQNGGSRQDPGSWIQDPPSWIQDPWSWIPDQGWIKDPESRVLDPGLRVRDPGSMIRGAGLWTFVYEVRAWCEWSLHQICKITVNKKTQVPMPTAQYTVHICKSSNVHSIQPPELDELENLYSPARVRKSLLRLPSEANFKWS
jgi:hypothetical protein